MVDQAASRKPQPRRHGPLAAALALALLLGGTAGSWAPGVAAESSVTGAGIVYVDAAGGADAPACGTAGAPCASPSYALTERALAGDTLRLAEGSYAGGVTLPFTVTLEGGYEATGWTRDAAAHVTVIDGGADLLTAAEWDAAGARYPAVLAEDGGYTMWYVGEDALGSDHIGRARSTDGLTWIKDEAAGLDAGPAGSWSAAGLYSPTVVHDAAGYHLWYGGRNAAGAKAIGYATSADGRTWTPYAGNPVVSVGAAGWNNTAVYDPYVLRIGDTYHMWVVTEGHQPCTEAATASDCSWTYLAHLTSSDGAHWTWDGSYAYESTYPAISGPCVVPGDTWHLWYGVVDGGADLALLTSADGATWERHSGLVFYAEMGGWEAEMAEHPAAISATEGVTTTYTLWYEGRYGLGAATSTDGIDWTRAEGNPVLTAGDPADWPGATLTITATSGAVVLDGLTITGGAGMEAGGVLLRNGDLTMHDCRVTGNRVGTPQPEYGGGLTLDGTADLSAVIIDGNQGIGAATEGLAQAGGDLTLTNVLVADHDAVGVYLHERADLMNVTVAGNGLGVMILGADDVTITNSIIYGNSSTDLLSDVTPNELTVAYCVVGGGAYGTGNTAADPLFLDAAAGDYRPRPGSPAVDSGTAAGTPAVDLAGTARPLDGDLNGTAAVDRGAYELTLLPVYLPWARR